MRDAACFAPIRQLIEGCWPGEWGSDPVADRANCVVYRATDIDDEGHLNVSGGAPRFVFPSKVTSKALQAGDILLEASGGAPDRPVGRVALVEGLPESPPALTSNFFRFIRPKHGVDARYLCLQLVALNRSSAIWRYQQQTTGLINLKVADYLGHPIWEPALPIQGKIAAILTSIDTAIEKTEALIEKYRQIKAGLMHDLFTRGVLPNGQLRPPRDQAPELYQETAIGWIPRGWSPVSLRNLVGAASIINGPFGSDLLTSELRAEGIPVLYVQDVKAGVFSRVSNAHVTQAKANELAFCNVKRDDVLVAKVGAPPCDSCVYPFDEKAVVTQDVIRVRLGANVNAEYISSLLNSPLGRKAVKRISIEGTRERVSLTEFKGLLFPIAESHEQAMIGARLEMAQASITAEEVKREKLRQQKLGLMQDLLSGKVPVKVGAGETANG